MKKRFRPAILFGLLGVFTFCAVPADAASAAAPSTSSATQTAEGQDTSDTHAANFNEASSSILNQPDVQVSTSSSGSQTSEKQDDSVYKDTTVHLQSAETDTDDKTSVPVDDVQITEYSNTANGIFLQWEYDDDSTIDGYLIYRKTENGKTWKLLKTCGAATRLCYLDKTAKENTTYEYAVKSFFWTVTASTDTLEFSQIRKITRMTGPDNLNVSAKGYKVPYKGYVRVKKVVKKKKKLKNGKVRIIKKTVYKKKKKTLYHNKKKYAISWDAEDGASKYIVQYAYNRYFTGSVKEVRTKKTSFTISNRNGSKTTYFRIRSIGSSDNSDWICSSSVYQTSVSTVSYLKDTKSKYLLNLRTSAGQSMGGYDTTQGACIHGKYLYAILWNKSGSQKYAKIGKWNLTTRRLVALSKGMKLNHGNSMCYDGETGSLLVSHTEGSPKKLTFVDPDSLTITDSVSINLPDELYGASKANIKSYKGISAIAYCKSKHCYVAKLRSKAAFLVLDQDLQPIRYIKVSMPSGHTSQNIICTDDYIIAAMSGSNLLIAYDWYGNKLSTIHVNGGNELESIGFSGSSLYGISYQSYYYKKNFYRAGRVYRFDTL